MKNGHQREPIGFADGWDLESEMDRPRQLEHLLGAIDPTVARILERARQGLPLSESEGITLATANGAALRALVLTADLLRQKRVGEAITYVVTRNINFTNVCFIGCKFCAFKTGPGTPQAWDLSLQEVAQRAAQAWALGATEVCMQGGLPRGLSPYHYRDLLRAIKSTVPQIHIHAFSPMEITYGAELTGRPLPDYLMMLREAGLDSIPGTAAEILDPQIRQVLSRNKVSVQQWTEVITTAHRLGIPTTSTMMYGHIEEPAHWVRHLLLLRRIQEETGGFTEFVPLGFVHFNTDLYRMGIARPGPTLEEHLKVHALGRLLLQGAIDHIQVSWVKLGPHLSQLCLQAGADDFGGTLMEENISRLAGSTAGEQMPPEEFRRLIRAIGRVPAQRTTTYELIHLFPRQEERQAIPQVQASAVRVKEPCPA